MRVTLSAKYLILFFIFISTFSSRAQSYQIYIDSMRALFVSDLPDTTVVKKIHFYYDNYLWTTGSKDAYHYLEKSFNLAEKAGYYDGQQIMINNMAQFNFRQGNYELTLKQRLKGLDLAEKNKDTSAISANYTALGGVYKAEKNYSQALKYYLNALNLEENYIKIEKRLGIVYSLVGNMYNELNDDSLSLFYQLKSLKIREKLKNPSHIAASHGYISIAYLKQKKYNLAELYARQSLAFRKIEKDYSGINTTANIIGDVMLINRKYDSAQYFYNEALNAAATQNSKVGLRDSYAKLSNLFETKNDIKKAFYYHKLFSAMNDSVLNSENIRNMAQMKEVYESVKKDNEINLLNAQQTLDKKEIDDQAHKIQSRNILVGVSMLSIVLLGFLVFFVFRSNQDKKRNNELLSQKNLVIEHKNKEIIDSINYAKRIQDSLLDNFDSVTRFFSDSFLFIKPKDIVSGDFYWMSRKTISDAKDKSNVTELFFLAVCDSTGHGVPGGFMSLLNIAYLSEAINEKNIHQPNKVFDYVRERLINTISKKDQKDGFDGVLLCFEKKFNFKNKELISTDYSLSYAAAHNKPVLISDGNLTELEADKMPVGFFEKNEPFKIFKKEIKTGDTIYVYTDGYADQFGGPSPDSASSKKFGSFRQGKKFKYKELDKLLLANHQNKFEVQREKLSVAFDDWKGKLEQIDDVLVVGIRV